MALGAMNAPLPSALPALAVRRRTAHASAVVRSEDKSPNIHTRQARAPPRLRLHAVMQWIGAKAHQYSIATSWAQCWALCWAGHIEAHSCMACWVKVATYSDHAMHPELRCGLPSRFQARAAMLCMLSRAPVPSRHVWPQTLCGRLTWTCVSCAGGGCAHEQIMSRAPAAGLLVHAAGGGRVLHEKRTSFLVA